MIYQRGTFKELTPPGYFDFSGQQTAKTAAMVDWFDRVTKRTEDQVNLFDDTFRLWATRDYSAVTVSMTPWIQHLLTQNGMGWFSGSLDNAVKILGYFSKAYPSRSALCFYELFQFLLSIDWITELGSIYFGSNSPAKFAEALVIYSTSGTLPATPAAQAYTALTWEAPTGWTKLAASATYYAKGYLSGGNIVWMTPRSTSGVSMIQDAANLAGLPGSPATGDECIVYDDGTGDKGSAYYYDGGSWRKTTTPNANQGSVIGGVPPSPGSSVFAPDSHYIASGLQPPASGGSQGFGYYGTYGSYIVKAKRIDILMDLTALGVTNLGSIIFLLRRIKPSLNSLYLNYSTPSSAGATTELEIYDLGAI